MLVFKDFLSFIILQRLRCLKKWHLYFLFFESRKFLHFLEFLQNFLNKLSFAGSLSTCHKGQMLSIYSSILLFRVKEFDHILGKARITDAWAFDLFLVLKFVLFFRINWQQCNKNIKILFNTTVPNFLWNWAGWQKHTITAGQPFCWIPPNRLGAVNT